MGACDERILTMLFLVVEKLRGEVRLHKRKDATQQLINLSTYVAAHNLLQA